MAQTYYARFSDTEQQDQALEQWTLALDKRDAADGHLQQATEAKEAAVARQQHQEQQPHAQVCEPAAQKEFTAATTEDDTAPVQVATAAATEIAQTAHAGATAGKAAEQ